MERPPIVRLYGHADSFDIEFSQTSGGTWQCEVPPDTEDGVYAVELWAVNADGLTAYWTGELWMSRGICHLVIHKPRHAIRFICPRLKMQMQKRCAHGY